jgi:hypothetical protein
MKRRRPSLVLLSGLTGVYLVSCFANPASGGYRLVFDSSINHPIDDEAGIAARSNAGAIAWQPRYGAYSRLRSDFLGKVFHPPIVIDQTDWHCDVSASEIASREWLWKRVTLRETHPDDRELHDSPIHGP